jgi:hypothetical protein
MAQPCHGHPAVKTRTPSSNRVTTRLCDASTNLKYLEMYEAMGPDEIMPLLQVAPISHGGVMEALRLFGRYIIPHFQAKAQASLG